MIWVIANRLEEDGSYPTYKYYKKAFADDEIDIYCAGRDEDFSFLKEEDTAIIRTRDENISNCLRAAQKRIGFKSTVESPQTRMLMYDKDVIKSLLVQYGIPCPKTIAEDKAVDGVRYFVKPKFGENSIGIDDNSLCSTKEQVQLKCQSLRDLGIEPIVEEYIEGFDVTASVIFLKDSNGLRVDAIEGVTDCAFQTFEDKDKFINDPSNPQFERAYGSKKMDAIARCVFSIVRARHYMRIDFRVTKDGTPYVIDVNMIPGLAPNGYMSRCLKAHGVGYHDMVRMVVNSAL
jgi:D-alanine-D-alanine ligase